MLTDVANPRLVDLYTLTMDTKWIPAAPLTRKSWNNMAKELAGFKRWLFREAHTQRQTVQEIVPATANEKPMCALAEPPAFTVLHGGHTWTHWRRSRHLHRFRSLKISSKTFSTDRVDLSQITATSL